jgi:PAS domain S-box-containing protein
MDQAFRILVWDGDASDRSRIVSAVETLGSPIQWISSSNESEFRSALDDTPDAVIVRRDRVSSTFREILAWAGDRQPRVPVLFVTPEVTADEALDLWHEGAADCLTFEDLHRLPQAIRRAIERARQEQQLHETSRTYRRYQEAIRATGQITFEWDQVTDEVCYQGDVEGITGFPPERINGPLSRYLDIVHPEDRTRFQRTISMARHNTVPCHQVYRIVRADGQIRHVESRGYLFQDDISHSWKRVGFISDITSIVQAQGELAESRRLLRTVLDNIPIGVFWKDRESRYLGCNQRVADAFGFGSPAEMIGKCDLEFPCLKREEAEFFLQKDREVMEKNQSEIGIVEPATLANGRRVWLETSKVPMHDAEGRVIGVMGIWQDVTEKKLLEDKLREKVKMEAIGRLAGGVAHDFNNLLTVINGYTDVLLSQTQSDDRRYEALTQIWKAGLCASGLTRQLLAFSRKSVLIPAIVNLNDLIWDMEKLLQPLLGEQIVLKVETAASLWPVRVDPTEMSQVIINLCINARDAMPEGGTLCIQTQNVELDDWYAVSVDEAKPGPHVCLSVSDTGIGMDESTLARIFEPFFTTKGPDKGTGLGLATVYGIVRQTGGHIQVKSQLGKGTRFDIYLPRDDSATEPVRLQPAPEAATPKGRETVLLVEDEDGVRKLARLVLENSGYRVLEATNGPDALRLGSDTLNAVDLLITDVVMPNMTGPQLVREIVSVRPNLRVLYVSGYTDDELFRHGLSGKEAAFLHKPFTPTHLVQKVREILDA